jgi:aconitate hydratase
MTYADHLGVKSHLYTQKGEVQYYSLEKLEERGYGDLAGMPVTVRILLESVLRQLDGTTVTEDHLKSLGQWQVSSEGEFPFKPTRVLMQDLTGVPAVVDLAAMRDAIAGLGGDPDDIDPLVPVDLVIDHSVQVDRYGSRDALAYNADREFERSRERYEILKWASEAFSNFSVVPPATGICHQVNLEHLAKVVQVTTTGEERVASPDTLVGLDSHTTMVNGLGVLGWGVGGIEAEAAMLGQPIYMPLPQVIGFRMTGQLAPGVTATDLVLTVTQMLREYGVVGRFVEFFGPGLDSLGLPDRATISNMCPEYGATAALFPVDEITLNYLRTSGRKAAQIDLVEKYTRAQGMFRTEDSPEPKFTDTLELNLGTVTRSIAGPKRPQDRIPLGEAKEAFEAYVAQCKTGGERPESAAKALSTGATICLDGSEVKLDHGAVVIAAITSCTNTSNPSVMIGAGLLAKRAVELGLRVPPHVKTSLAPGSKVVRRYLELSGLMPYLEALGFHLVGFGCTTCIGNSGPLRPEISQAIKENDLIVTAVLSGNRNFEGRIHQEVRANYLASPPLVVAYALAGTMDKDLTSEPLGHDNEGKPVYLGDIWPSQDDIRELVDRTVSPDQFREEYGNVYTGNERWNQIRFKGDQTLRYPWDSSSTYIRKPPFFEGITRELSPAALIRSARVLAILGESVTTDHISPAGAIAVGSPAARWLLNEGVSREDFNTFGSRRGNHEVMMRGTFGNIRIRNAMVPGVEGGYTLYLPDGDVMTIYEAARRYAQEGTPLIVIAGRDYGMGSSRDWAAKGPMLLGVKAVIAESYERIHRSNLFGMGVLPLQFLDGQNANTLGLTGREVCDIETVTEPGQRLRVRVVGDGEREFAVQARIDSAVELNYYRHGGILQTVLLRLAG